MRAAPGNACESGQAVFSVLVHSPVQWLLESIYVVFKAFQNFNSQVIPTIELECLRSDNWKTNIEVQLQE
jgi:hypothetical protein